MNQDWYPQFFNRMTRELVEHLAGDMQRIALSAMAGASLESILGSLDIRRVLEVLGGVSGFQGFAGFDMQGDSAYRMLGLEATASDDEIKHRYRELAKRLHPDVAGRESTHLFRLIQAAYDRIGRERGWNRRNGGAK